MGTLAPGRRTLGRRSNQSNFAIFHVQTTLSLNSRSIPWKTSLLRMNINHARRFTPARPLEVSTARQGPLHFPDPQRAVRAVHPSAAGVCPLTS